ncbi:tyrosine-type recombinase/integrase [Streptomyces sp. NPDC012769]|uniref:tyrosine-type recombinase/integrase n=1 Tax=Streptomyces sp. NPDC012769 TaxID=3364848 RepID=UPI0036937294
MYVQEAVHLYLQALAAAGVPDGTVRVRRTVLHRLAKAFRGRKYRGLTKKDMASFLYGPGGILVGITPNTRSVYRSSLRGFFEYGEVMEWGPAVSLPKPVITLRNETRRESPPTRLPEPVLVQLLDACPTSDRGRVLRGMMAVAINTAWRVSDIQKLRVEQIDLMSGSLNFQSQKTRKLDSFPISLDLESEIREYMSWYTLTTGVTWRDNNAYLFPAWTRVSLGNRKGFRYEPTDATRPVSYSWALIHLHEHLRECGIRVERNEAWHVIRRSVARIYFDSLREQISYSHALRQTAALLQHESTATTEKYLGLSSELEARDASLRGKPFIGVSRTGSSVVALRGRGA